jgi:hypothetical protein
MPKTPAPTRGTGAWDAAADRPSGPSWLVVQIMAAGLGLLLIAAVLLPLAMGVRLRDSEAAARERGEQIGLLTDEIETLRRQGGGGAASRGERIAALEAERDDLRARLDALAALPAGPPTAPPGPVLDTAGTPAPLGELLRAAGSVAVAVDRIGRDATIFGLSEGALGFTMQQRFLGLLPGLVARPEAPTRLVATIDLWTDDERPDHGIVTVTLHLEQPWRLDEGRVSTVTLWSRSFARDTTRPTAQADTEDVLRYLVDLLDQDLAGP